MTPLDIAGLTKPTAGSRTQSDRRSTDIAVEGDEFAREFVSEEGANSGGASGDAKPFIGPDSQSVGAELARLNRRSTGLSFAGLSEGQVQTAFPATKSVEHGLVEPSVDTGSATGGKPTDDRPEQAVRSEVGKDPLSETSSRIRPLVVVDERGTVPVEIRGGSFADVDTDAAPTVEGRGASTSNPSSSSRSSTTPHLASMAGTQVEREANTGATAQGRVSAQIGRSVELDHGTSELAPARALALTGEASVKADTSAPISGKDSMAGTAASATNHVASITTRSESSQSTILTVVAPPAGSGAPATKSAVADAAKLEAELRMSPTKAAGLAATGATDETFNLSTRRDVRAMRATVFADRVTGEAIDAGRVEPTPQEPDKVEILGPARRSPSGYHTLHAGGGQTTITDTTQSALAPSFTGKPAAAVGTNSGVARTGPVERAIVQQVTNAVSLGTPAGRIEVMLDPPDLGKVEIAIEVADQSLRATVSADRHSTGDLIRRHLDVLSEQFREAGFDNVDLSYSGRGGHSYGASSDLDGTDAFSAEIPDEPASPATGPRTGTAGRIDIRL